MPPPQLLGLTSGQPDVGAAGVRALMGDAGRRGLARHWGRTGGLEVEVLFRGQTGQRKVPRFTKSP